MRVRRFTNLRRKPLIRLSKLALFRSTLGGSVVVDITISFLTDRWVPQKCGLSCGRRLRERTSRTEGPLSTPARIEPSDTRLSQETHRGAADRAARGRPLVLEGSSEPQERIFSVRWSGMMSIQA